MKLSNVALISIIILITVSLLFPCIEAYNKRKEGMDSDRLKQIRHLDKQINYYKSRKIPAFQPGVTDDSDFIKLKEGIDETLVKTVDSGSSLMGHDPIQIKIEKCLTFNHASDGKGTSKCKDLIENDCGFCFDNNTIMYGTEKGPHRGTCKQWIPAGPESQKQCEKKIERTVCGKVKDCGDAITKDGIKCGWCPISQKGMTVKPIGDEGGFVPKYKEDKCVWPKSGGKEVTYKGGSVIQSEECKNLGQMFPCVGPNALGTRPEIGHSDRCYQDLWNKSKCTGTVNARFNSANQNLVSAKEKFNRQSYIEVGDAFKQIHSDMSAVGDEKQYLKAKGANKLCRGVDINPCSMKFRPTPMECLDKKYKQSGCLNDGKLNPKNVSKDKLNEYKSKTPYSFWRWLTGEKRKADRYKRNPKLNYNEAIKANEACYGNHPKYPGTKLCWNDFKERMLSHLKVYENSRGDLVFKNEQIFHKLLPYSTITLPAPQPIPKWANNTEKTISKDVFDNTNFPYWDFLDISKRYWKNNWGIFRSKMLRFNNIEVTSPSYSKLVFKNKGIFKDTLKLNNIMKKGRYTTINKSDFEKTGFQYWDFMRVWRNNK